MAQNDDASAGQDTVTGLPNAGTAALTIAAAIERANRDGSKFPIFSLSISRLNTINQAFGRDAGDAVLREFGQRLADAGDGSAACIAGNCFIFVGLPAETNASFDVIRDRVVARLAEPFGFSGERHQLSSAIGLAIFPEHGREPAELLQAANFARRLSKADGGNSVVVWDLAKAQEGSARFALENELRGAARRGELRLFYQPKVKMPGARLVGFEALLRWQHPVHGLLTPGAFLDIAEEANIMRPLTKWAYKQVGRQLRAWIDAGLAAVPVAINTPPSEFTGNLLGEHLHEFERHGVPTRLLEIEITESKMTEDIARFCEVGEVLKQRGIKVAMDDFGTGYSCLSTLGKLPITTLKIDYIFTSQLLTGRASRAIAVAILSIAREMDVEVVAEGVETPSSYASCAPWVAASSKAISPVGRCRPKRRRSCCLLPGARMSSSYSAIAAVSVRCRHQAVSANRWLCQSVSALRAVAGSPRLYRSRHSAQGEV